MKRWMTGLAMACGAACADGAATEPLSGGRAPATIGTSAGEVVRLLKRTAPLGESITASALIGPRGGHLQIPQAGIRVEFPRGAVAEPTMISVTALAGGSVAYRFAPHGLVFAKPVTVRHSLRRTTAWRNPLLAASLQGSYFERLVVDVTETYSRAIESRPGAIAEAGRRLDFTIEHFSGYMISTGKLNVDVDLSHEIVHR